MIQHIDHTAYLSQDQVRLVFEGMTEILQHHSYNLSVSDYAHFIFYQDKGYLEWFFNTQQQCWVTRLYVKPEHRRQGIATELIAALEDKRQGLPLTINTTPDNAPMQAVLKKLGFKEFIITYTHTC